MWYGHELTRGGGIIVLFAVSSGSGLRSEAKEAFVESRCSSCSGVSDGLQYKQALHMSPDGCNSNRKLCHWASCPAVLSETQTPGGGGAKTQTWLRCPKSSLFLPLPPPLLQRVPNTDAQKKLSSSAFQCFNFYSKTHTRHSFRAVARAQGRTLSRCHSFPRRVVVLQ